MVEENETKTVAWKTNNDVFRGYMKASMEGLQKKTDEMQKDVKCIPGLKRDSEELKKDMKSMHGKISKMQMKVAAISGTVALIITIVMILLKAKIFN